MVSTTSEFRPSSQARTIHPRTLIILLSNPQIRKRSWHNPSRRRPGDTRIFLEIFDLHVIAQKVFVQKTPSSHVLGWRLEDGENGVGEDCWLA
jgi:hypothetical protein